MRKRCRNCGFPIVLWTHVNDETGRKMALPNEGIWLHSAYIPHRECRPRTEAEPMTDSDKVQLFKKGNHEKR